MAPDSWDPTQYRRFERERTQPFVDLLGLVRSSPPPARVIDLGCGTGHLTRRLHEHLRTAETLGIDSSAAMLEQAATQACPGLRFERADVDSDWGNGWDLIFSNAALQWLDDHEALFAVLAQRLAPEGQLAIQMPANADHPSHRLAGEIAAEPPFASALAGYQRRETVLPPEQYSLLFHRLGFVRQHVRLQVYAHVLAATADVVEWTRGTLLTAYQRRMPPALFPQFVDRYRQALLAELGDVRPFLYPFKRMLLWASR